MKYELHPACAAWPQMSDADINALADDIKVNTLLEPLTLTPDGLLLDGRNREKACALAGVTPTTVVYDGDPILFSLSKNKHRRHMSRDQIAIVAAALVTTTQGRPSKEKVANATFVANAVAASGLRKDEIKSGIAVHRNGTAEEIEAVKTGKAKLRATADTVRKRKKGERPIDKARKTECRAPQYRPTEERIKARSIVRPLVLANQPINVDALAAQHKLSHVTFRIAKALEEGRLEGFDEAGVAKDDPIRSLPFGSTGKPEIAISLRVLIEELSPLFERARKQSKVHFAYLNQPEMAMIAGDGMRLLDKWASGDESVRRARGHVVPFKRPTKKKG